MQKRFRESGERNFSNFLRNEFRKHEQQEMLDTQELSREAGNS